MQEKTIKFIRPYQLATRLKVTPQTIYRWIREGKVAAHQFRKVTRKVERFEISETFKPKKR